MGYRKPEKTFLLEFEEEEYAGLFIEMRTLSIKEFLTLTKALDRDDDDMASLDVMFRIFSKNVKAWNLEDEYGQGLPATYDSVTELDVDFVMNVVAAWTEGMAGTKGDLGKRLQLWRDFPVQLPEMDLL